MKVKELFEVIDTRFSTLIFILLTMQTQEASKHLNICGMAELTLKKCLINLETEQLYHMVLILAQTNTILIILLLR